MIAASAVSAIVFARRWVDRSTGLSWLVGNSCPDFQTFEVFPSVVEVEGKRFVKTGWNSDFETVYYREATASDLIAAVH